MKQLTLFDFPEQKQPSKSYGVFTDFTVDLKSFLEDSKKVGHEIPNLGKVTDYYKSKNNEQYQVNNCWYHARVIKEVFFSHFAKRIIKTKIDYSNFMYFTKMFYDSVNVLNNDISKEDKELVINFASYLCNKLNEVYSETSFFDNAKFRSKNEYMKIQTSISAILEEINQIKGSKKWI